MEFHGSMEDYEHWYVLKVFFHVKKRSLKVLWVLMYVVMLISQELTFQNCHRYGAKEKT